MAVVVGDDDDDDDDNDDGLMFVIQLVMPAYHHPFLATQRAR